MSEIIPIPRDRASEKRPIHIEFRPRAFPGQRFQARFDWNHRLERWVVEIVHVRRDLRVIKAPITPYRPYPYWPFVVFLFADPTGEIEVVNADNLGDEVKFFVFAGPSGQPPEDA
jgi:hypothetical protein